MNEMNPNTDVFLVHQVVGMADFLASKILQEKLDITYSQYLIMVGITLSKNNASTQKAISKHLEITQAAVSRQIDNLYKMGLVSRLDNPENRRQNLISLTKEGAKKFSKAHKILLNSWDALFININKEQREVFEKVLLEIKKSLKEEFVKQGLCPLCPHDEEQIL